jgi:hypothetical protein
MEKEKLLLAKAWLRLQEEQKALVEKIWTTMELFAPNTFWNQVFCVYYKHEGHLMVDYKNINQVWCHICQRSNHSTEACWYNFRFR